MEIIESIKEGSWKRDYHEFEGIIVKTNKQEIKIGIDNGQSCCESWGHFSTNDEPQDFVGAEITGVKLTKTCLNTIKMQEKIGHGLDGGDIQFVDIETNKGAFQYAIYNSHNGYYGHSIEIKSEQLSHEDVL